MLQAACSKGAALQVKRAVIFVKSALAGAAATLTDFTVFFALANGVGLDPRWANLPALVAGGVVNFVGNRRFAFHAHHGSLTRQAQRFIGVTVIGLALNAVIFHFAVDALTAWPAWVLRVIIGNAVYVGWYFPMFRKIFHVHATRDEAKNGAASG